MKKNLADKTKHGNFGTHKLLLAMLCAVLLAIVPSLTVYAAEEKTEAAQERSAVSTESAQEAEKRAAGTNSATPKKETVYAALNGYGVPKGVYVVNQFDLESAGSYTDYGKYTKVEALSGNSREIKAEGEKVRFRAEAGRYSYRGDLAEAQLPWTISLRYRHGGQEVNPLNLSGVEGPLTILMDVKANAEDKLDLAKHFAMQVTVTLDPQRCHEIKAEGATMAESGRSILLNYLALPGKDLHAEITMNVEDFRLEPILFSGVSLSVEFDKPDTNEFIEGLQKLQDGIKQLDTGSDTLANEGSKLGEGSGELTSGAGQLSDAASALKDGMSRLSDGIDELGGGFSTYRDGVHTLAATRDQVLGGANRVGEGFKALNDSATPIREGGAKLREGMKAIELALADLPDMDVSKLDQLAAGSAQYLAGIQEFAAQSQGLGEGLAQLGAGFDAILDGVSDLPVQAPAMPDPQVLGQSILADLGIDPAEMATNQAAQLILGKLVEEKLRSTAMLGQMVSLRDHLQEIRDGISQISSGSNLDSLASAASELADSYVPINAGIQALVQGIQMQGEMLTSLPDSLKELSRAVTEYSTGVDRFLDGVSELEQGFNGSGQGSAPSFKSGLGALFDGLSQLDEKAADLDKGLEQLKKGSGEAQQGAAQFAEGAKRYQDGVRQFMDGLREYLAGVVKLSDGTQALQDKTGTMTADAKKQIDEVLDSYDFGDFKPISFVSNQNSKVKALQFTMMTPLIEAPDKGAKVEAPAEDQSFWGRLKRLFVPQH